jgi:hypothetical protein
VQQVTRAEGLPAADGESGCVHAESWVVAAAAFEGRGSGVARPSTVCGFRSREERQWDDARLALAEDLVGSLPRGVKILSRASCPLLGDPPR